MTPIEKAGDEELELRKRLRDAALKAINAHSEKQLTEKLGTLSKLTWSGISGSLWEFELSYRVLDLLGGYPRVIIRGWLDYLDRLDREREEKL